MVSSQLPHPLPPPLPPLPLFLKEKDKITVNFSEEKKISRPSMVET